MNLVINAVDVAGAIGQRSIHEGHRHPHKYDTSDIF